ncbi:MAG: UPF0104 family protein [Deltaproteobacteria bacterium]|nr:MAG: UPF0104 family protein [Deltaproteobacteria bacterium]
MSGVEDPTPDRVRGRVRLVVGLAIGAIALTLALWGVPLRAVGQALRGASLPWLLVVAAIFVWQQAMRAWRQLLIIRALRPTSTFRTNLSILCISFLAINTLPARLGEVVRPLLLLDREGIPLGMGFAVVFLERVVDLVATLAMLLLVAWLVPIPPDLPAADWLAVGRGVAGAMVAVALAGVVVLLVFGRGIVARLGPLADRGPRPWRAVAHLVIHFSGTFLVGLDALRSPARLFGIAALTAVTWAGSVWMYPAAAEALGLHGMVGYGEGLGILALTMIGGVIPAPPGMAGTYEAFVRAGLAIFGVAGPGAPPAGTAPTLDAAAVAFALTMHWWVYAVQAATAAWFLAVDRVDLRRLLHLVRSGAWRRPTGDEAAITAGPAPGPPPAPPAP